MPTAVENIIWTALPNGRSGARGAKVALDSSVIPTTLKLSAMVTFQLSGDGTVLNPALFPTASNWDATQLKFQVKVKGMAGAITPTSTSQSLIQPALWKQLVPSQLPLPFVSWDAHFAASTKSNIASYDTTAIMSWLNTIIQGHVSSSFVPSLPPAQQLSNEMIRVATLSSLRPAAQLPISLARARQHVGKQTGQEQVMLRGAPRLNLIKQVGNVLTKNRQQGKLPGSLLDHIVEAQYFHRPIEQLAPPAPTFPDIDFHKCMAMVGQHPQLMRVLGIVVDLEIPAAGIPANGEIYLSVTGPTNGETWHFPHTVYELGNTYFRAQSRTQTGVAGQPATFNEIVGGFMNLTPGVVNINSMDIVGQMYKTVAYASALEEKVSQSTIVQETFSAKTTPREKRGVQRNLTVTTPAPEIENMLLIDPGADAPAPPPYSRSSGITFYKVNRAAAYLAVRAIATQNYAALKAEPAPGNPDSSNIAPLYFEDLQKGWRPDVMELNKTTPSWCSLNRRTSMYRIGSTMVGPLSDEATTSTSTSSDPSDTTTQYLHEALFTWTGWSLATPKPGQPLQDDGSRTTNAAVIDQASATAMLQSYVIGHSKYPLATSSFTPPGALPTLRFGMTYQLRARAVDLAGNSVDWTSPAPSDATATQTTLYLRQEPIGPPTLSPTVAPAPGGPSSGVANQLGSSAFTLVVRKYKNGNFDNTDVRLMAPSLGDVSQGELHGMLDTPAGVPDPAMYAKLQEFDNAGPLPVFIPANATPPHLPFLPDPASQGACLAPATDGFPGVPLTLMSFYNAVSWPYPNWGKLTLSTGTSTTNTATGTNFAVTLQPGQKFVFNLSSTTTEPFLTQFNQSWALENSLQAHGLTLATGLSGRFPKVLQTIQSFTKVAPYSIHVKTVFPAPTPTNMFPKVDTGPSPAQIYLLNFLNGRNASLSPPTPVKMIYATQIPEAPPVSKRISATREPSDTKGHIRALASCHGWSTQELEYSLAYTDSVDDLAEPVRTTLNVVRQNRAFSLPVPYQDAAPTYDVPQPGVHTYEFHDTKTHTLNFAIVAKSRYTSCFPAAWQSDPTNFTLPAVQATPVIIPSSRRPDPVAVEAIFPLFQLTKGTSGTSQYSGRKGNSLRIYLRRPWFSSGNGEQLAVILANDLANESDMPTYSTVIGTDPAFKNPALTKFLTTANFPDRAGDSPSTYPPALKETSQGCTAALFNPVFDTFHQMWTVDMEIDPPTANAYTPFIRLALCRYQGNSIANCNVSSITLADITQLHAHRMAILQTSTARQTYTVSVTATAVAESSIGKNIVVGTLEYLSGTDPDTGWTQAIDSTGNAIENTVPLNEASPFRQTVHVETDATIIDKVTLSQKKFNEITLSPIGSNIPIHILAPSGPGVFNLPDPSKTYRIVLREYEIHMGGSSEPYVMGAPKTPAAATGLHVVGRLVYVDTLAIPAS